jgi:hypothetical protein
MGVLRSYPFPELGPSGAWAQSLTHHLPKRKGFQRFRTHPHPPHGMRHPTSPMTCPPVQAVSGPQMTCPSIRSQPPHPILPNDLSPYPAQ